MANNQNFKGNKTNTKLISHFAINLSLFISSVAMVISGFIIQINYHFKNLSLMEIVCGVTHHQWCAIHKWSASIFFLLTVYHIYYHWKWSRGISGRKLQTDKQIILFLSLITPIAMITGVIPWFVDIFDGDQSLRSILIEFHDKIAILLFLLTVFHMTKRRRWYINTFRKI